MDNGLTFDYFYGMESEQFTFFRIPKLLVKDKRFEGVSNDAKLLYGLMLDRMSLSVKNKWFDSENRAYIIYTVEDVMEDMNCANGKACKLLINLEQIGLIERKKPGLGRPAIIYVKNFMSIFHDDNEFKIDETDSFQHDDLQEKTSENPVKSTDVRKSHANNTDINNTELSNTDISYTHSFQPADETELDYSRPVKLVVEGMEGITDTIPFDEKKLCEERVKEKLFYDYYMRSEAFSKEGKKLFEVMVQRIVRMATDTPGYIMVKDRKIPGEVAKSVFLKLRDEHVMYCIDKIEKTNGEIRNPGAYIDALLYSSYTEYAEKDSIEALQAVGSIKRLYNRKQA